MEEEEEEEEDPTKLSSEVGLPYQSCNEQ